MNFEIHVHMPPFSVRLRGGRLAVSDKLRSGLLSGLVGCSRFADPFPSCCVRAWNSDAA